MVRFCQVGKTERKGSGVLLPGVWEGLWTTSPLSHCQPPCQTLHRAVSALFPCHPHIHTSRSPGTQGVSPRRKMEARENALQVIQEALSRSSSSPKWDHWPSVAPTASAAEPEPPKKFFGLNSFLGPTLSNSDLNMGVGGREVMRHSLNLCS